MAGRADDMDWRRTSMSECTETRRRRLTRRAAANVGDGFNRAHRGRRFAVRLGWFAHRGGVCRCGQTYRPARPSSPATWRRNE